MKVLHGMREVAGQGYYSVKGLKEQGCNAELVLWDPSPFGYPADKCLDINFKNKAKYPYYMIQLGANMCRSLMRYDIFHFHFGHSLLPLNVDLPLLKKTGKKVFCEFHGDDVRNPELIKKYYKYLDWAAYMSGKNVESLKMQRSKRARNIMKYAERIILHDDELIPHVEREGYTNIEIVPLRIDISRFIPTYPSIDKKTVTIVHAPTSSVKGTKWFVSAIEKLSSQYSIKPVLIQNLSQKEALKQYQKADIIFDQITVGTYGVFSIEAMAMGKPVITYISDQMRSRLPEDLPLVSASPESLYDKLEELIRDAKLRLQLGKDGRKYVSKYHDCRKNAKALKLIYEGKGDGLRGRDAFQRVVE